MKLKDIDSAYLKKISAGYQWLMDERYDLGPNLAHAACPRWRNPVMAPVILLKRKINASDLKFIENHFAKNPKRHAYDTAPPSLMLYDIPFYDRLSNQGVLERAGWSEARRDLYLNVWLLRIGK